MELSYFFDMHSTPDLRQSQRSNGLPLNKIRSQIANLSIKDDAARMSALSALIHLWHDYWNEAHEITQRNEGHPDCDLVHALVHRREGDLSNTQYWLSQIGTHPAYAGIAKNLADKKTVPEKANDFIQNGIWNALAFAREVVAHPRDSQLKQIQAHEFLALAQWWWPTPMQT